MELGSLHSVASYPLSTQSIPYVLANECYSKMKKGKLVFV